MSLTFRSISEPVEQEQVEEITSAAPSLEYAVDGSSIVFRDGSHVFRLPLLVSGVVILDLLNTSDETPAADIRALYSVLSHVADDETRAIIEGLPLPTLVGVAQRYLVTLAGVLTVSLGKFTA